MSEGEASESSAGKKRNKLFGLSKGMGQGYMALEQTAFLICNRTSMAFKFQHLQFVATLGDADTTKA